jgi:xanthine dehydrogenase small subunit
MALGATLVLDGPDGERRLPLEDFFHGYKQTDLKPGEFVHSVRVPAPRANEQLHIYKVSKRLDDDISAVLGAFRLTVDNGVVADCRLAFGGMAATPARAPGAEAALKGQPWNNNSVTAAITALASDFSPLTDARASAGYRLQVAGNLLRRALLASTSSETLMVTDYA